MRRPPTFRGFGVDPDLVGLVPGRPTLTPEEEAQRLERVRAYQEREARKAAAKATPAAPPPTPAAAPTAPPAPRPSGPILRRAGAIVAEIVTPAAPTTSAQERKRRKRLVATRTRAPGKGIYPVPMEQVAAESRALAKRLMLPAGALARERARQAAEAADEAGEASFPGFSPEEDAAEVERALAWRRGGRAAPAAEPPSEAAGPPADYWVARPSVQRPPEPFLPPQAAPAAAGGVPADEKLRAMLEPLQSALSRQSAVIERLIEQMARPGPGWGPPPEPHAPARRAVTLEIPVITDEIARDWTAAQARFRAEADLVGAQMDLLPEGSPEWRQALRKLEWLVAAKDASPAQMRAHRSAARLEGLAGPSAAVYAKDAARYLAGGDCRLAWHHLLDAREALGPRPRGALVRRLDALERRMMKRCAMPRRPRR